MAYFIGEIQTRMDDNWGVQSHGLEIPIEVYQKSSSELQNPKFHPIKFTRSPEIEWCTKCRRWTCWQVLVSKGGCDEKPLMTLLRTVKWPYHIEIWVKIHLWWMYHRHCSWKMYGETTPIRFEHIWQDEHPPAILVWTRACQGFDP